LKQVENGATIPDICRKLGISDQTFYRWKHQYEGLGVSELQELRQLRDEKARLKRLVADRLNSGARRLAAEIATIRLKAVEEAA
jgi:transposase-like protein